MLEWRWPPCGPGSCVSVPWEVVKRTGPNRAAACLKQKGDFLGWWHPAGPQSQQQEVQAPPPQPQTSNTTSVMTYIILYRFIFAQTDATTLTRAALWSFREIHGRGKQLTSEAFHMPNLGWSRDSVSEHSKPTQVFLQKGCLVVPGL